MEMLASAFVAGQEFEHGGVRYRVRNGNRCEGDLVIEFHSVGWHRPTIAHTLILASFKYQVEQNNYGPNGKVQRGQGGWYLLGAIKRACFNGWRSEADRIVNERVDKVSREEAATAQLSMPI